MTNYMHNVRILILIIASALLNVNNSTGQEASVTLTGTILESGTGTPLSQAVVSVMSNSEFTNADSLGAFILNLPSAIERIMVSYPGYLTTDFYTHHTDGIVIYLTKVGQVSGNNQANSNLGSERLKYATNSVSYLSKSNFENTSSASFDQSLSGKVAGVHVIEHSGMPGHSSWINIRGLSSIFGRNQPIMFVDGMLHEIHYPKNELIEGSLLNPMDIVDIDDIESVSIYKIGEGHLGSAGSNGYINVNTENYDATTAAITIKMYGGIAFPYQQQEVLDADQFETYFQSMLNDQGYSNAEVNDMYPWLNGGSNSEEYYRYNNKTNWQKEMATPAALQKYYVHLKGGDDIATYNISTGYLRHGAQFDPWKYSRYNLRLNGKINITNKLYVIPNTKLSLSDSYLSNMGPTAEHNAVTASLQKSPLMMPYERSAADGSVLRPYDDVGVFDVSNPMVLINEAASASRNFQLLSSGVIGYDFNNKFSITNLVGVSVNNDRNNIFIPDIGVVQIDSARNSPQDMSTEHRSFQNHTTLNYKNTFKNKHNVLAYAGARIYNVTYKNSYSKDLNTASDDFRSLGQGSEYSYLRTNGGQLYEMKWVSYFADLNYSLHDVYFIKASLSLDASSVFNDNNRYNFYPSVFGAWRLGSTDFVANSELIDDMKIRASFSQTGNMFSGAYELSKPTYTGRRYQDVAVPIRDYNPNEDLKAERKSSINAGIDLALAKEAFNISLDYHMSMVNNLMINQSLPYNFGFTDYIDNGGKMVTNGVELGLNSRSYTQKAMLTINATVTYQTSKVTELNFLNPDTEFLLREAYGAQYIASVDNPINAFYGLATDGIYNTDAEAGGMVGPNGRVMEAGDVKYVDLDDNGVIDDSDKQIIGDPNPGLFGGLSASLKYERLEFSALFTYSVGNEMYNYVRYQTTAMDSYANQSVDVLDRWQSGSTNAELPKATYGDPKGNNVFSDRWIEDASYLKFKQFMISYTTPGILSFRKETKFYITGTNLFTFTKYSGYDPETMYQNDPYFMGIDYGKVPHTPSVIIGIQLSL